MRYRDGIGNTVKENSSIFSLNTNAQHCVQKKTCHSIFALNFAKCWLIFKILSAEDLALNFQQSDNKISHHTSKHHYTTLWNINVRKTETTWNMYYDNDTSQCSVTIWFRCGGTFDHYFTTNSLLSLFWKNFQNCSTLGKVMGKRLLPQVPCVLRHCPAEKWTCLRFYVRRAETVVTASHYN